MKISFIADLEPLPFKRVMQSGKRRFNDRRYSDFKDALGLIAKAHMQGRAPLSGKISFRADFYKHKPKNILCKNFGDLDNFVKAVLDALTGICFQDDRQVTEIHAEKFFGEPHITITIEEVD